MFSYIFRDKKDKTSCICVKCLIEKELSEFYVHSVRSDGFVRYRQICKNCRRVKIKKNKSRPIHEQIIKNNEQSCHFCKKVKPLSDFYSNGCFTDGVKKYRTKCKECVLQKSKLDFVKNYPSKLEVKHKNYKNYLSTLLNRVNKRNKKGSSNLDMPYVLNIYESQNGCCAICGSKMTHSIGETKTNISFDRIDSSLGYIKGNLHLTCYICNIIKNKFSLEEVVEMCEKIVKFQKSKQDVKL